ncbi:MAG: hypothetical protein F6K10_05490 [Moorea sp. SIO2B7]|nr:hypothetical protein [Moorena sp. SIO2B7]
MVGHLMMNNNKRFQLKKIGKNLFLIGATICLGLTASEVALSSEQFTSNLPDQITLGGGLGVFLGVILMAMFSRDGWDRNGKLIQIINHERTLAMIFLIVLCSFLILHNAQKPRLLILHSYATDYSWVTAQNEGMQRILKDKTSYIVKERYLDTKRKPYPEYMKRAGQNVKKLIKRWKPNLIIACDDNAQILVGKYFVNDPNIKIVFTGVQGDLKKYGYDTANNVTGIREKLPAKAIKETLNDINKSLEKNYKRIFFITHSTTHSQFVVDYVNKFEWEPFELVSAAEYKTFEDWKKAVQEAEDKADVLLIGGYKSIRHSEQGKSVVCYRDILEWTEANSRLLKIGTRWFYVEDGGMISVGISPYEQGEEAAKMAVKILDEKTKIEEISIKNPQQYLVSMREKKMKEYDPNLKLPSIYEAFARATNKYFQQPLDKDSSKNSCQKN